LYPVPFASWRDGEGVQGLLADDFLHLSILLPGWRGAMGAEKHLGGNFISRDPMPKLPRDERAIWVDLN